MKLKNYIKKELQKGKRTFDVGLNNNMTINDNSLNRTKFKIERVKQMKDKLYQCNCGCGLSWVQFKEKGCPAKKENYFLTEKEILKIADEIRSKK